MESMVITLKKQKGKLDRLGGKHKNGIVFVDTQRPVGEVVRGDSGHHGLEPRSKYWFTDSASKRAGFPVSGGVSEWKKP